MDKDLSIESPHHLHTNWIVWYHSYLDKNWDMNSYKSILQIRTIEDLLVLINSWDKCLPLVTEGMFFIMRKTNNDTIINPRWEDKHNINGGYWSFKVTNSEAQNIWYNLSKLLIGETISTQEPLEINGISISPKKNFCIIKIWNKNREYYDIDILSSYIDSILNKKQSKYSSHNKNIQRDANKINKFKNKSRNRKGRDSKLTRF